MKFPEILINLIFEMLTTIISEMLITIFVRSAYHFVPRNVSNYNFQNYWQLLFHEILAIIYSGMLAVIICRKHDDERRRTLTIIFSKMLSIIAFGAITKDVCNYNFQKCWQLMLAVNNLKPIGNVMFVEEASVSNPQNIMMENEVV